MAKINLDKYYTPSDLAEYCVKKTKEVIGEENVTEWLEPSAGAGVFLPYLDNNYLAFDIEPEAENIEQANYLELELPYFKGRCVIGNPPFGTNTLVKSFYNKSINICDYIAFILPISQFDNNYQLYKFDLIHSEKLHNVYYSKKQLDCCFNIYSRPKILNKKPCYKLKDVVLHEYRRGEKELKNVYDIGICSFGRGIIGNIPKYVGYYAKEIYFEIKTEKYKSEIIDLVKNTEWESKLCLSISGQTNLSLWKVYKYLREQIPQLV